MIIIPAIDIKDNKVVRLYRGEFDKVKVYSEDPVSIAQEWEIQGAKLLHIVDLDGALTGQFKNLEMIEEMINSVSVPVQVGGGIRTRALVDKLLSIGVHRVVLGTRACEDDAFVQAVLADYGEKIVVSLDAKDGMIATDGWTNILNIKVAELLKKLEFFGLRIFVYTDISRDGTLNGPNIDALQEILKSRQSALAISSGGVSSIEDLLRLKVLESEGLLGVIVGKALYEKKINLEEAISRC